MQNIDVTLDRNRGRTAAGTTASLLTKLKGWQERRRTTAQLNALDERLLTDIGIHRGQIAAYVDSQVALGPAANDNRARAAA